MLDVVRCALIVPKTQHPLVVHHESVPKESPVGNHIRHFAVHAADVARARRFYAAVFAWRFEPWGPPDFYLIHTGDEGDKGVQGALQGRQTPLSGTGMRGFECTIGVEDLDAIIVKIEQHGGRLLSPPFKIPGVGTGAFFEDTEGNRVGIMQYDPFYPI
jgi:predicted enzyme related to lactoylglutathione lyase